MPDCREKIIRELEGKLTVGEIEHIFEKVERKFFSRGDKPKGLVTDADMKAYQDKLASMSIDERWTDAAKKAFDEAVQEKKDALRREYLQTAKNDFVLNYLSKNKEKGHVNGIIKLLVGDLKGTQKELTLEARKNGILQLDMAEMTAAFDKYMEFFGYKLNEEQAKNIVKEMDAPGSTGDTAAKELVDVWTKLADRNRTRKNELGANIGYLKNWRIPQSWDAAQTKKFGLTTQERIKLLNPATSAKEKNALHEKAANMFIEEALKRVDRERYLGPDGIPLEDEDLRTVLYEIFNTITTNGLSEAPQVGKGKGSLAQKLGEHRELHFKSAEDWYEFNKTAGSTDILGIMQKSIIQNARDTALLDTFGPNPEQGFKSAVEWAKHLDAGVYDPEKINKIAFTAENIFQDISGFNRVVGSELVANIFTGLRQWMVASKLGSVLLSQPTDLASYTAIARTDGLGVGRAMEFAAKNLSPLNPADKKLANQLGIAAQAVINDVAMRYGETVKGVNLTSRFANATITLGGMRWWTDSMQRAYQQLIGFGLADAAPHEWGALDSRFRSMLERYGIKEADWNIIRQAQSVELMGEKMITPVAIKMLGDAPEMREVAIKVAGMMHEESYVAVATPGPRQRAFINERAAPGTKAGEIIRSFALFHSFTLAMTQKVLPRIYGAEGTGGFRAGLAAQFALGMIIAGGFAYQMKEITKGRNPRDITDPKFWLAAAVQSGGAGIFGDFLFSDVNKFGGGMMTTLGGPVFGLLDDFKKLTYDNIMQAAKGEETHVGAESIQFVKNYTPFINLFYTRAALDHLLFFTIQEAANPGYLRRMRSRVKRENNQTFWWDPQDTLPEEAPDFNQMIGGR